MSFVITILLIVIAVFIHEVGHIIAIYMTKAGEIKKIAVVHKALFQRIPAIGVYWDPDMNQKNFRIKRKVVAAGGVLSNLLVGMAVWGLLEVTSLPNSISTKVLEFSIINVFFAACLALPIPIKGYDGWKFWEI